MGESARALVEYYKFLAIGDETTLVVRGATVQEVVAALGGVPVEDLSEDELYGEEPIWAEYTIAAIEGGVLVSEDTGYADPPNDVLVALSRGGRAAAVVRDNIQAHCRFGCARDGVLVFDDDDYRFLEDRDAAPDELRAFLDLTWVDLDDDDHEPEEDDTNAVGLAMAEVVTGLRLTAADADAHGGPAATVVAVRQLQSAQD